MYSENELIPISALQHYLFCPRQCALIHLDQVWAENAFTAEGRLLHSQFTGDLETGKGYDRARFFAFLKEWAPPATP